MNGCYVSKNRIRKCASLTLKIPLSICRYPSHWRSNFIEDRPSTWHLSQVTEVDATRNDTGGRGAPWWPEHSITSGTFWKKQQQTNKHRCNHEKTLS